MKRLKPSHRVFLSANGDGPWPCFDRGELVQLDELLVHHVDENHDNDDPANLVPMHQPCHISLHKRGKAKSAEQRVKISDALRGRKLSAETRQRMSATRTGKKQPPRSPEHTHKLLESMRAGRERKKERLAREREETP